MINPNISATRRKGCTISERVLEQDGCAALLAPPRHPSHVGDTASKGGANRKRAAPQLGTAYVTVSST
jgi:hypothetical protein